MRCQILEHPPWSALGSGAGATIAVLDSGFSNTHPALRDIFIAEARSFTGENPLCDLVGHGTESCSILVAKPGYGGPVGVAQEVTLYVGQVISLKGTGTVAALCSAINWAAELNVDIVAIPSGLTLPYPELEQALTKIMSSGTQVIAPVGNPYAGQTGPMYPAAYPGVVAVGCIAYLDSYRKWSRQPDLVVPAHHIPVCTTNGRSRLAGGTSQATMLAAGYLCIIGVTNPRALLKKMDKGKETKEKSNSVQLF